MRNEDLDNKLVAALVTLSAASAVSGLAPQQLRPAEAEPADDSLHHELDPVRSSLPERKEAVADAAAEEPAVAEEDFHPAAAALLSTLPEFTEEEQSSPKTSPVESRKASIEKAVIEKTTSVQPEEEGSEALASSEDVSRDAADMINRPAVSAVIFEQKSIELDPELVEEDRLEKMPSIIQEDLETMPVASVSEAPASPEEQPEEEPLPPEELDTPSQDVQTPETEEEEAGQDEESGLSEAEAALNARIVDAALSLVDTTNGMQCTEVVAIALNEAGIQAGIDWPDTYLDYGYVVDTPNPGNLVYYDNGGRGTDHIAIYIGDDQAVHGNFTRDPAEGPVTTVWSVNYQEGLSPTYIQVQPG